MAASNVPSVALAVLISTLLVSSASAYVWGGASSAASLENLLVSRFNALNGANVAVYKSTNSPDGVNGFKTGAYLVGVSADPMTASEELQYKARFPGNVKLTIPQVYTAFSFISTRRLSLTPQQLVSIFNGRVNSFAQLGVSPNAKITVIVRSDGAATTNIITKWFKLVSPAGWPSRLVGDGPFRFPVPGTVYKSGNSGVTSAVATTKNSISYVQSGFANAYSNVFEVRIKNRAGKFVGSAGAVQGLPRSPPAPTASWAAVSLLNGRGANTYPIVTFIYTYYRSNYIGVAGGAVVKAFGLYAQSSAAQGVATSLFFFPLPPVYTSRNKAALSKIKANI